MAAKKFWLDRNVLITGASSGIGEALALELTAAGARVGLLARRESRLQELSERIAEQGGQAAAAVADVRDLSAVRTAAANIQRQLGPIGVLIANAGVYRETTVKPFDAVAANEVIATNVLGVVNAIDAVLPGMIERGEGRLAAVASMAAMLGLPGAGAYCASKAAVVRLLQSLRVDLHPHNIQVIASCPSYVDTAMITDEERATLKGIWTTERTARRVLRAIEIGRAEDWYPFRTWLTCRLASLAPSNLYRLLMAMAPELPDAEAADQKST